MVRMRSIIQPRRRSKFASHQLPLLLTSLPQHSRSLRQTRPVPSAAEGLDQRQCTGHSRAQDIHRRHFIRKCGTLRGDHLKVTCNSSLVTSGGERSNDRRADATASSRTLASFSRILTARTAVLSARSRFAGKLSPCTVRLCPPPLLLAHTS
jgi:hypothetical protein